MNLVHRAVACILSSWQRFQRWPSAEDELKALQAKLRDYPYWWQGHLRVAKLQIERGEIEAAYAASQAVLQLAGAEKPAFEAKWIIGRCYLAHGDAAKAREILKPLAHMNAAVLEDIAAAELLLGQSVSARETLSSLQSETLSPAAAVVRDYLVSSKETE